MGFASDLDKYLTTPPNSGYQDFAEAVDEEFSEDFWDHNEELLTDNIHVAEWYDTLYEREYSPKQASAIIERGVNIFFKTKNRN